MRANGVATDEPLQRLFIYRREERTRTVIGALVRICLFMLLIPAFRMPFRRTFRSRTAWPVTGAANHM